MRRLAFLLKGINFVGTLTLFIVVLFSACSPQIVKIDQATRESIKEISRIKVIYYSPPELWMPFSQAGPLPAFGVLGEVLAPQKVEGSQVIKAYDVQDPVIRVRDKFFSSISKQLKLNTLSLLEEPLAEDTPDKLKTKFPQDTIFDFKTTMWGISTDPFQGYHYVLYHARGRLIQFPESKIIWQGICRVEDKDSTRMPHWSEFIENNGAILKEKLNNLAISCADDLAEHYLK
jgi:hypothetical protein